MIDIRFADVESLSIDIVFTGDIEREKDTNLFLLISFDRNMSILDLPTILHQKAGELTKLIRHTLTR
ncbi:MAG: hypothetical protein ABID54_14915 [Pseudomonadota bacterium]